MTIFIILVLAWLFMPTRKNRRRLQRPKKAAQIVVCDPPKLTAADIARRERAQERARKAEIERDLAAADVDRLEAQKETLVKLLDAIEAELDDTADPKRITALLTRQATTESKIYSIDRRIDRAYMRARL